MAGEVRMVPSLVFTRSPMLREEVMRVVNRGHQHRINIAVVEGRNRREYRVIENEGKVEEN